MPVNPFKTSSGVRRILVQVQKGDFEAINLLFSKCLWRVRQLAHRMFVAHKSLQHFEQSDDLLQETLIRLHNAVVKLKPDTTRAFMALALQHARWALRDLARDMRRRKEIYPLGNLGSKIPDIRVPSGEPEDLLDWEIFHQQAENLDREPRDVFEARFYGGLTFEETVDLLGLSLRTVKRRWKMALNQLGNNFRDGWPNPG
jgi:RNA polymerase sigma factor (sigma-70 family)